MKATSDYLNRPPRTLDEVLFRTNAMAHRWRSIETAPKDREILVWSVNRARLARWAGHKPEPYWKVSGFCSKATMRKYPPTHWMPLPPPPKETAE